jgi:phosphoglycerate kinase
VYVNDGFSVSHRAHASTEGVARLLPAYAGPTMLQELEALQAALGAPKRPLAAVVGGSKVSTKITLLKNLVEKADLLVIGGGMANTFLAAQGYNVGASLYEKDFLDTAKQIMKRADACGVQILLPVDVVTAKEFKAGAAYRVCAPNEVNSDEMILDAGPKTVALLKDAFAAARTVIWNGPLGAFETEPFHQSTVAAAKIVADLTKNAGVVSVAGGGDTVSALNLAGVSEDFTYVSGAGGAFLEWMEGKVLPGVAILEEKETVAA